MPGETVLVIDDSPTILKVVQLVLTKAGVQVATAPDGEAGVTQARDTRPGMILLARRRVARRRGAGGRRRGSPDRRGRDRRRGQGGARRRGARRDPRPRAAFFVGRRGR